VLLAGALGSTAEFGAQQVLHDICIVEEDVGLGGEDYPNLIDHRELDAM
jgi:hypothetical protein